VALVLANRVQETATPNTTVSFTLTGAVSGFQTFAVIGNTNTTYYSATDASGNWEVGEGTYSTTGPTLTRTTVYASSNSGSAVTFPGSVNVFVTYPSGKSVNLDGSGNVSALGTVTSGTWQGSTVGVAYGGTGQTSYTDGQLLIGNSTGNTLTKTTLTAGTGICISNGSGSITIASTASVCCATPLTAGIVYGRTEGCIFFCGNGRTALGSLAGNVNQGVNAVAIGHLAGQFNQGACAIAIGLSAGCSGQPASSIAIGSFTAPTGACQTHIGPVRSTCSTTGLDGLFYCACTREVIRGTAGGGVCCATPTVAGKVFGITSACFLGGATTALGYQAGGTSLVNGSVAIGTYSGSVSQGNCAVAVGRYAGACSQSSSAVSVGNRAGYDFQGSSAVAIGVCAAAFSQQSNAIAIGRRAGYKNQSTCAVAIGACAGYGLGCFCFPAAQGAFAVAVGACAGRRGQGAFAVAIGREAGKCCQGAGAVAVGSGAGSFSQPIESIAVGLGTTAFGPYQTHIGPVRSVGSCTGGFDSLFYNACTREMVRGTGGGGGVCCATPTVAGKVFGRTDNFCGGSNTGLGYGINFIGPSSNSVVIGTNNTYNRFMANCNVVVGAGANVCCCSSSNVSIGSFASVSLFSTASVAIGSFASASGSLGVAVGNGAFATTWAVAVGAMASASSGGVVLNGTGCSLSSIAASFYVKPIRNASGPFTLKYCPCSGEITYN